MNAIIYQTAHDRFTRAAGPGLAQRAIDRLLTWQRRANERRHLMQLDDRMLADVGLTRADVEHEYATPFWR